MAVFPSLDWFSQVRDVYNSDSFRHSGGGGACDTVAGLKVNGEDYIIEFAGLKCEDVRAPRTGEMESCDFIIEMTYELWKGMVANVKEHGHADATTR